MEQVTTSTNRTGIWGTLSLACGIIGLVVVLTLSFFAVKNMHVSYRRFAETDLSETFSETLSYDDHLYACLGAGIEIVKGDPEKEAKLASFLDASLQQIGERILSAGIVYTMLLSIVLALFLYGRFGSHAGRHTLAVCLGTAAVYLIFLFSILVLFACFRIPFRAPSRAAVLMLTAGFFAVMGGGCALGLLLRSVRHKRLFAVAAIPLGVILMISGMLIEGGLFAVPELDSFDYVYPLIPPDDDTVYYDEEQNAFILNGEAYPPERVENPNHFTGIAKLGGIAYEVLNPYAGNGLEIIRQIEEEKIPAWVLPLYLCKALCWIVLPATLSTKRKRRRPPVENEEELQ